tara:strand:- start:159 stop:353 length:195 start_codon:yes stop_codon:yes gene_type:complete
MTAGRWDNAVNGPFKTSQHRFLARDHNNPGRVEDRVTIVGEAVPRCALEWRSSFHRKERGFATG